MSSSSESSSTRRLSIPEDKSNKICRNVSLTIITTWCNVLEDSNLTNSSMRNFRWSNLNISGSDCDLKVGPRAYKSEPWEFLKLVGPLDYRSDHQLHSFKLIRHIWYQSTESIKYSYKVPSVHCSFLISFLFVDQYIYCYLPDMYKLHGMIFQIFETDKVLWNAFSSSRNSC